METKLEKNLYKITWPIFLEMLFFVIMGSLDTVMLSGYDDLAVAAVGVSNNILFIYGIIISVVATGITTVIAQYLGSRNYDKAKITLKTGVLASIFVGIIAMLSLFLTDSWLLNVINTDDSLMNFALTYIGIVGVSLIFASIGQSMAAGLRSYSKPGEATKIVIIGNIINVILNYVLIYGKLGFPPLGVEGAAIGTLVSRFFMMIALIVTVKYHLDINILKLKFDFTIFKKILRIGLPSAGETTLWNISQIIIVSFINIIGVEALIARTYAAAILSYIYVFTASLANGNSIIVGYFIGENTHDEAHKHTMKTIKVAFLIVGLVTLIINIFPYHILGIFTDNPSIIDLTRTILYLAIIIEVGRSMNFVFIFALRSTGDSIYPVVFGGMIMFLVTVPAAYILGIYFNLGLVGIYIAIAMDEVIRGLIMYGRWQQGKWRNIKLIES